MPRRSAPRRSAPRRSAPARSRTAATRGVPVRRARLLRDPAQRRRHARPQLSTSASRRVLVAGGREALGLLQQLARRGSSPRVGASVRYQAISWICSDAEDPTSGGLGGPAPVGQASSEVVAWRPEAVIGDAAAHPRRRSGGRGSRTACRRPGAGTAYRPACRRRSRPSGRTAAARSTGRRSASSRRSAPRGQGVSVGRAAVSRRSLLAPRPPKARRRSRAHPP